MAVDNGAVTCSNLSVNQVGPYSQTLALGCSITNLSMNVGWGSTSSSCNLTLVRDNCKHWRDESYAESNTYWQSLTQQGPNSPPGNPYPTGQGGEVLTDVPDPRRTWQRNLAIQQVAEQNYKTNVNNPDSNAAYGDFGKQMWYSALNGGFGFVNWLGPDPGFLANADNAATQINNPGANVGYDVNGTCVFVKMEDLFFGGIIKSWENRAGQGGVTTSVQLESMASLLKGTSMIINNFNGSVGSRYYSGFTDIPIVTVPSNEAGGDVGIGADAYNGSVRGGNHPNLINLQGLANFVYGFTGAAWAGTKGVSAADIYFVLNSVLNPANISLPQSPYFPYGAMVGRSLVNRFTGTIVDTTEKILDYNNVDITYEALGWMPTKLAIDNRFRPLFSLDLSEVPVPPADIYFTEDSLTITAFLDAISQGGQYDYIVDCVPSTNSLYSACIKIRTVNRSIAVPPNTLLNSLNTRDDFQNISYGEEFDTADVREVVVGAPQQRLMQFTTIGKSIFQETRVYDPFVERGGGLPRGSDVVVPYGSQMVTEFDPNPEVELDTVNVQQGQNSFQPNLVDVRWYKSYRVGAGVVAQTTTTDRFFTDYNNGGSQGAKKFGNYGTKVFVRMPAGIDQEENSYPLCSDLISPFYGKDSTGNIRLVYFDRKMGQIQVMTSVFDWRLWCSYATPNFAQPTPENANGEADGQEGEPGDNTIGDDEPTQPVFRVAGTQWIITETEIRAAMSGIDVFFHYLFDYYKEGFVSMTAKYFYDYIAEVFCTSVADQLLDGGQWFEDTKEIDGSKAAYPNAEGIFIAEGPDGVTKSRWVPALTDYRVFQELKKLMKFLAEDIGDYHSKSYLIRMPQVYSFIDRAGNRQYNYQPSDFGWEEEGNPLDDTMVIGSSASRVLANGNGTFGPIVGFLANLEFDGQNQTFTEDEITNMKLPTQCPEEPDPDQPELDEDPQEDAAGDRLPNGEEAPNQPNRPPLPSNSQQGPSTQSSRNISAIMVDADADGDGEVDEVNDNPNTPIPQGPLTEAGDGSPPKDARPTKNLERGWYQPLDLSKVDKSTSIYYVSVNLVNDRNSFYAALGYPIVQTTPFYNTPAEAHNFRRRNLSCYRKAYLKANYITLNDYDKTPDQLGFSRMHGGSPCVALQTSSTIDQIAEPGVDFVISMQKFLLQFSGFQLPKESGLQRVWQKGRQIFDKDTGKPTTREALSNAINLARARRRLIVSGQSEATDGLEKANRVFKRGIFAIPVFAMVPVRYNTANYGPWATVPGTVENLIFNDSNPNFNATLADNMVGGVKVKYDSNAAPWNYGGIEYLDYAKLTEVTSTLKGQQSLEKATFSVPGILLSNGLPVSIGSFVAGQGAIVNSLSTNISAQGGFSANYTLRTYVKKIGFYNNERAKEIAELGKQNNDIRNELTRLQREAFDLRVNTTQNTTRGSNGNGGSDNYRVPPDKEEGIIGDTSPVEALVGKARPYIPNGASFPDEQGYNPSWHVRSSTAGATTGPDDTYQHISRTTLYKDDEFVTKFMNPAAYGAQSMMSLDGIISPISFYPTPYGATYHITKYDRKHCPYCKGTGSYRYKVGSTIAVSADFPTYDEMDQGATLTAECTFCTTDKEQERNSSAGKTTIRTPPYIIDKGTDAELQDNASNVGEDICQDSRVLINYSTLTPVVMSSSSGEFAVSVNRQEGDLCAHSIRMVGVGWQPPTGDQSLHLQGASVRTKNYSDYDISYSNGSTDPDFEALNNARFMGLRGPMMLHGWGYDVDGYPVPNASGDIKYGEDGAPVTDQNGNPVYSNQVQLADGSWSDPFPEQKFAKNWASAPNTWPVGPIDLRWNPKAKLWTVGTSYTDVYVTLENDLKGDTPVRAVLTDAADNTDPLPDGYRKLVFVQDPNGFFSAPRGATIYAKYNTDSGFYNPIFNNTTVTSGVINAVGAATVYIDEAQYDVGFSNPLQIGVNVGGTAIFMFINGEWVVQATSCR